MQTNFNKLIQTMTIEDMAELLTGNFSKSNTCLMCAYRDKQRCGFHCLDGIEKWLKQEEENHE
jgi:hypothetical protein